MNRLFLVAALWLLANRGLPAADTLVLCPPGWAGELRDWIALRTAQGHAIEIAEAAPTVDANRRTVAEAAAEGDLACVLLVGDADAPGAPPPGYAPLKVIRRWGPEKTVATDHVYADLGGDAAPEVALGRIPATTPNELREYLRRVLAYERRLGAASVASPSAGGTDRMTVVASPAGFSPLLDPFLESTATRVLTELTPPGVRLDVTYASPSSRHYPGVDRIHRAVAEGLARPAVAWVYLGHGLPWSLGEAASPTGPRPLLTVQDLATLPPGGGPPIAAIFACYTGAFDAHRDCLAERLLATPAGPLTVVAASRVTMPYGNAVLGVELLRGLFREQPAPSGAPGRRTIGELVKEAKRMSFASPKRGGLRSSIDTIAAGFAPEGDAHREVVEHVQAYNLLGDPLLTVGESPGRRGTKQAARDAASRRR